MRSLCAGPTQFKPKILFLGCKSRLKSSTVQTLNHEPVMMSDRTEFNYCNSGLKMASALDTAFNRPMMLIGMDLLHNSEPKK